MELKFFTIFFDFVGGLPQDMNEDNTLEEDDETDELANSL